MIGPHAATAADVYWESSWPQDFRNWIAPQIFVEPTFAAYRSNQDVAMDAILGLAPWVPISQHPGFWCKSEQPMDTDEQDEPQTARSPLAKCG
jgi:hypothetical protein